MKLEDFIEKIEEINKDISEIQYSEKNFYVNEVNYKYNEVVNSLTKIISEDSFREKNILEQFINSNSRDIDNLYYKSLLIVDEDKIKFEKILDNFLEEVERLKFNNYMARMEMVKFRNSLSIENIERNMEIVVGRMVEQFFLANYYNNPAFMQSNGLYTPPFINEARRKIDMFAIYATFQRDVSNDFLEELALIYKYDVVSSESFIVTNYIAPIYNRAMRKYKKAYKDYLYNESEHRLRLAESRKINPFWSSNYSEEQEDMIKELNELYPIDEKKEAMREYLNDLKKRNGTLNR